MSVTTVKWKFVTPWGEEQHEEWLQEQARQGLHLQSLNSLGFHTFRRGPAQDMAYRWTVIPSRERAHYEQLYQDAGWERAGWIWGYHCWRKPAAAGQTEIFTEVASKIRQHWLEIAFILPFLLFFASRLPKYLARADWMSVALYGFLVALETYTLLRLGERILRLKRPAFNGGN